MKFAITLAIAMVALGACSSYKKGEVVQSSDREIRIAISYDAIRTRFEPVSISTIIE